MPSGASYDEALASLFEEMQRQIDSLTGAALRKARPDLFERVDTTMVSGTVTSLSEKNVIEATSRLCFVLMPFAEEFDAIYRLLIEPVAREMGMDVLRADQMTGPGFIIEQIRSAIQQARACVADVTNGNQNVLYEVGYAQALGKPLVLMADADVKSLPFDIAHQRMVIYKRDDIEGAQGPLRAALLALLSEDKLAEADRLFQRGEYRGAIAAAVVVLEQHLRDALEDKTGRAERMAISRLVTELNRQKRLPPEGTNDLSRVIVIRNAAIHSVASPPREDAEFVLNVARGFLRPIGEDAVQQGTEADAQ